MSLKANIARFFGLSLALVAASAQAQSFYVSPAGSDANPGSPALPFLTLTKARDAVRAINSNMAGDLHVYLRGGVYPTAATISFDQRDSGTNGHDVVYEAYPGETPVISGGQQIVGWTPHPGGIYKASCTIDNFRQLWVNGTRATRARSPGGLAAATDSDSGHTTSDLNMQNWGNKTDIEFIYDVVWTESRCGVSNISGNTITMKQPGYAACRTKRGVTTNVPTFLENAYELLDSPGEWYLDRTADMLYYFPRPGENMATATVMAPVVETLVNAIGTLDSPIRNIRFEGISFSHATWLRPGSNQGLPDIQATWCKDPDVADPKYSWVAPLANVNFETAHNIHFERCKFTHLGAMGLSFRNGSQGNTITGCTFSDIAGGGIGIGGVAPDDWYPSDVRKIVKNNTASNNYITDIGFDYRGAVALFAGYTRNTQILHNYITAVPYSAISIGWGWGENSPTIQQDNLIMYNKITDAVQSLEDGGPIYSIAETPGQRIAFNYSSSLGWGIYLDFASSYNLVESNVVEVKSMSFRNSLSFSAQTATNIDDLFRYNYYNGGVFVDSNSTFVDNYYHPASDWPQPALDIIRGSGLEAAYRDIAPITPINAALGKPATASSTLLPEYAPNFANDGNTVTGWSAISQTVDTQPWWQVDLGAAYRLSSFSLVARQDFDQPETRRNLEVRGSNTSDFSTYTVLGSQGNTPFPHQGTWKTSVTNPNEFRYLRVAKTVMGEYLWLTEFRADVVSPASYTLTQAIAANGSASIPAATQTIQAGGTSSIDYSANPWFRIASLTRDAVPVYAAADAKTFTNTFSNVAADHLVEVTFKAATAGQAGIPALVDPAWAKSYYANEGDASSDPNLERDYLFGVDPRSNNDIGFSISTFTVNGSQFSVVVQLKNGMNPLPTTIHGTLKIQGNVTLDPAGWTDIPEATIPNATFNAEGRRGIFFYHPTFRFFRAVISA